jgi:hypothetical protein
MQNFKKNLAFLTVPAVLALGVVAYGSVVGAASPTPTPKPPTATQPAEAPEAAEPTTAAEAAAEANEPALPGGGYADPDNVQADTQQEGVH